MDKIGGFQSQQSALQCDAYKGHEVCQTDFHEFFATFFLKNIQQAKIYMHL